jgi:protein-L-isoaspartate(D-aspartate) O-methyltransferase
MGLFRRGKGDGEPADGFEEARRALVAQLRRSGIRDERVLAAMGRVPRELFVPAARRSRAYEDRALPIGCGQTISQPYMVALMTEELHLTGGERVLEVGTGSGYQAAVLAELAGHVYTVERVAELHEGARRVLCDELGYGNVSLRLGDGTLGWPEEAPFERVIVTAGAPARPDTLLRQLRPGGEAVVPVGEQWQVLTHYRREPGDRFRERASVQCVFVKLIGEEAW